jgi:cytochrome c
LINIMKKLIIVLSCSVLALACGSNSSDSSAKKDSASTSGPSTSSVSATDEKALELIGASDCTTCHKLGNNSPGTPIGPAYTDVAAKYAPAADSTVNRLVQKIISGGSGVWGTVPMTPHAALKEADVRVIVQYILTLKK